MTISHYDDPNITSSLFDLYYVVHSEVANIVELPSAANTWLLREGNGHSSVCPLE